MVRINVTIRKLPPERLSREETVRDLETQAQFDGASAESRSLGFSNLWSLYESYEIVDGGVRPTDESGASRTYYAPARDRKVLTALARVVPGDEASALAFVHRWGLLGFAGLMRAAGTDVGKWSQGGTVWEADPAERLDWIWAHADTVHFLMEALRHRRKGPTNALKEYLRSRRDRRAEVLQAEPGRSRTPAASRPELTIALGPTITTTRPRGAGADPDAELTRLLDWIINENLKGMNAALVRPLDIPNGRVVGWRFVALTNVIYWHLANVVMGDVRLERCAECDNYFEQTDARQRYCPPAESTRVRIVQKVAKRPESLCARRARMRRHRQAQRRKNEEGET